MYPITSSYVGRAKRESRNFFFLSSPNRRKVAWWISAFSLDNSLALEIIHSRFLSQQLLPYLEILILIVLFVSYRKQLKGNS